MLNIGVECHFVLFKISDDRCHIHIPLKMVNMPFTDNRNVQRFVQRQLAERGGVIIFSPHPLLLAKVNVQLYLSLEVKNKIVSRIIHVNLRHKRKKIYDIKSYRGFLQRFWNVFFMERILKKNISYF